MSSHAVIGHACSLSALHNLTNIYVVYSNMSTNMILKGLFINLNRSSPKLSNFFLLQKLSLKLSLNRFPLYPIKCKDNCTYKILEVLKSHTEDLFSAKCHNGPSYIGTSPLGNALKLLYMANALNYTPLCKLV